MFRVFLLLAASMTLLFSTASVQAFVDPPTFEPAQPVAGQPVRMSVRAGECHGFISPPLGYPPAEINFVGNNINVIMFGHEAPDPILCIFFPPGVTTVDIGSFPQGVYEVTVQIRERFLPYPIGPVLASSRLTIAPRAQPTVIPAVKGWGLAGLGLAMLVAAGAVFRRQMI